MNGVCVCVVILGSHSYYIIPLHLIPSTRNKNAENTSENEIAVGSFVGRWKEKRQPRLGAMHFAMRALMHVGRTS